MPLCFSPVFPLPRHRVTHNPRSTARRPRRCAPTPRSFGSGTRSCPTGTSCNVRAGAGTGAGRRSGATCACRPSSYAPCVLLLNRPPSPAQIEKGELKIHRRLEIQEALDKKVSSYKHPFQQLKIQYGGSRGKNFTEDEDRFMVRRRCSAGCCACRRRGAHFRARARARPLSLLFPPPSLPFPS